MNASNNILVDFCLPIRNEALILENSLNKLLAYCRQANFDFSWRIIGVVNGTSDASAAILRDFKQRFPNIIDLIEVAEPGRGRALKKYWTSSRADILCYMDCDLATSLDNIPALIRPLVEDRADLAIGSRLSVGAATKRSFVRELVSQSYNLISRLLLDHQIADLQCGFKAVRREVFKKIEPHLLDVHWFFDTELIILALRFGFRVEQVPVDWRENRHQKRPSTVKFASDSWAFLKNLLAFRKRLKRLQKISR